MFDINAPVTNAAQHVAVLTRKRVLSTHFFTDTCHVDDVFPERTHATLGERRVVERALRALAEGRRVIIRRFQQC